MKVSVDAAELLAGLDHPGGAPAQRSKVMGDVPSDVRLCHPVPAWDWKNLPRDHSRGVLLHDQWISKHYRSRHNLPVPTDVPRRLRGLRRVQRLGAPRPRTVADAQRHARDSARPQYPRWGAGAWPNHLAIPVARAYVKHTGSPLDLPSKTIKAGVHGVSGGEAMLRELDGSAVPDRPRVRAGPGLPTGLRVPGAAQSGHGRNRERGGCGRSRRRWLRATTTLRPVVPLRPLASILHAPTRRGLLIFPELVGDG